MEQEINTSKKEIDFSTINVNLNTSIEPGSLETPKSTDNKKEKKDFNFTNILAVIVLLFLILTVIANNISKNESYMSSDVGRGTGEQVTNEVLEDREVPGTDLAEANGTGGDSVVNDNTSRDGLAEDSDRNDVDIDLDEGLASEDLKSALNFSALIGFEPANVEGLEVSYYIEDGVINKDLTEKTEDVFSLLGTYSLKEVAGDEGDDKWEYKLNLEPHGKNIYTVFIGDHIDIVEEPKTSKSNTKDESSKKIIRTFQVADIESLQVQLNQLVTEE